MLKQIFTVLKKELLDARRDLKALMPALLLPLLFAGMTYGTIWFWVSLQDQPRSFELAVEGAEHAVPLMNALREAGINIVAAPTNPAQAVSSQQLDMVLVIPEDFNEIFRAQKRASLDLIWDISRMDSHTHANRVKQTIRQWAATTGALRLLLRGVSPEVAQVLVVNDVNVASDQEMVGKMLSGLPMILLLIAFASGAGMCCEMAAGERENKTLEPLRINPVSSSTLFGGKWLAAIAVTLALTLIGVALQILSVNAAPTEKMGLRSALSMDDFLFIMLLLLPVIFLATVLQLLVSFLSRSFKDAQSYSQFLMLLPVLPGGYLLFSDAGIATWQMWIPLLGPQILIAEIFNGQTISWLNAAITVLASLVFAGVCAAMAIRVMKREH